MASPTYPTTEVSLPLSAHASIVAALLPPPAISVLRNPTSINKISPARHFSDWQKFACPVAQELKGFL